MIMNLSEKMGVSPIVFFLANITIFHWTMIMEERWRKSNSKIRLFQDAWGILEFIHQDPIFSGGDGFFQAEKLVV